MNFCVKTLKLLRVLLLLHHVVLLLVVPLAVVSLLPLPVAGAFLFQKPPLTEDRRVKRLFKKCPHNIQPQGHFFPKNKDGQKISHNHRNSSGSGRSRSSNSCCRKTHHDDVDHPTDSIHDRGSIIQMMPLAQVNSHLQSIMMMKGQNQKQQFEMKKRIATVGYVAHRRSFGSSLAFLDLVHGTSEYYEDMNNTGTDIDDTHPFSIYNPLRALLKVQDYDHHRTKSDFAAILKSLYPGTKVYVEGVPSGTNNPGEVVLLVQHLRFEMCSRNPEHVKGILQKLSRTLQSASMGNSNTDEKSLDCASRVDKSVVRNLNMEDFRNAFGARVNMDVLERILKGQMTVMDRTLENVLVYEQSDSLQDGCISALFNVSNATNGDENSNLIPFAAMARVIVKNLPQDLNYPWTVLKQSGRHVNQGQDRILPTAPDDIKDLPSHVKTAAVQMNIHELVYETHTIDQLLSNTKHKEMLGLPVAVQGWVVNRKRFQTTSNKETVTILELVDETGELEGAKQLKCIIHPEFCIRYCGSDDNAEDDDSNSNGDEMLSTTNVYGHLLAKGSKTMLQGYFIKSNGRPALWVRNVRLLRCTWRPATVKYFLDLIAGRNDAGKYIFDAGEIASALDVDGHQEAQSIMRQCRSLDNTERQWLAAEFSRKLQNKYLRHGQLTDDMSVILNQYTSIKNSYPLEKVEYDDIPSLKHNSDVVPVLRRNAKLKSSTEGSRWSSKKKPQLEFMANEVKELVESHVHYGTRPINILDVGGGRGYLSNYLSCVLGSEKARVHVIDIDSRAVSNGIDDAKRKHIENVYYGVGDASNSTHVSALLPNGSCPDIIIALHACGALSDVALGYAVSNKASFVITPCCFRSNPHLHVSIPYVMNRNETVSLTPSEWLGLDEKSMISLTKAAELQGDIASADVAIHTICALRARAVEKNWRGEKGIEMLDIRIKTFPFGFSTRNYCIVGKAISTTQHPLSSSRESTTLSN